MRVETYCTHLPFSRQKNSNTNAWPTQKQSSNVHTVAVYALVFVSIWITITHKMIELWRRLKFNELAHSLEFYWRVLVWVRARTFLFSFLHDVYTFVPVFPVCICFCVCVHSYVASMFTGMFPNLFKMANTYREKETECVYVWLSLLCYFIIYLLLSCNEPHIHQQR